MFEVSQQPFDAAVCQDAAVASDELNFDIDFDIDMGGCTETHPSPIAESEASINDEDEFIDIEDVVLEYKGVKYPCNTQTLMQGSKVFSATLQDYEASQFHVSNTRRCPILGALTY